MMVILVFYKTHLKVKVGTKIVIAQKCLTLQ